MSVITTWEAVPNRLEQFWLYLVDKAPNGMAVSDLAYRFSPPSLGKRGGDEDTEAGGNIFEKILPELLALGFVERRKEDDLIIPQLPSDNKKESKHKKQWFIDRLRRLLMTPEEAKERGQDDVPLALAWVALQSPIQPIPFGEARSVEIGSAFPGNENFFRLNTDASLRQCYYWARYLGLATVSVRLERKGGKMVYTQTTVPDPTVLLRSMLSAIFEDETELTSSAFLNRLGRRCPVLERGEARRIILSQAARADDFPGDDELSEGTSLAMLRLQSEGLIAVDDRSDARELGIICLGSYKQRFSHVRLEGGNHGTV